ncbi:RHS repeat domain-containing protein [Aquimarina sp. AU119]|uniref:RHS repeat domain-containing protein n=1 Tax=Aquimarina sp. AU119 TaxID=2108528 RepID=UPI001358A407|nr:RHS repeat-associated core domain-containing protein [Aquimarina sp. AU119]
MLWIFITNTAGNITYIYDATGAKLKKIAPSGSSLIETEYAGNYIYKNDQLQYMPTPEGYATPNGSSYRYVYQFKDHLDNVRLSYTKNDTGTLEIIEESNYYPFGLTHKGYNNTVSSLGNSTAQLLKFGGKEEQNELGLEWLDFGARNYDATLGRWMNIDPLADNYWDYSPYNYVANNPILFIDPDGQRIVFAFEKDDDGNRKGEQSIKDNINNGLGGGDIAQIDKNGNLTLNLTKEQRANLSEEQSEFLGVLEEGINAIDADGNSVDVNIGIVEGDDRIVFADFGDKKVDISDVNNVGNDPALNPNSVLGHELNEQYQLQLYGNKDYSNEDGTGAHDLSFSTEEKITGYKRGKTNFIEKPTFKKIIRRGAPGRGTFTYYTASYKASVPFTKNGKTRNVNYQVINGNVVKKDK